MPNFSQVTLDPVVEGWINEVEEILGRSIDAKEKIAISEKVFARIHQTGYSYGYEKGRSAGYQEHQNSVRGQDMGG